MISTTTSLDGPTFAYSQEGTGGLPKVFGMSSGAVLALRAAPRPADHLQRLTDLRQTGQHGDAVALFMTEQNSHARTEAELYPLHAVSHWNWPGTK